MGLKHMIQPQKALTRLFLFELDIFNIIVKISTAMLHISAGQIHVSCQTAENYLWLIPGEKLKTFECCCKTLYLHGERNALIMMKMANASKSVTKSQR